MTRLTFVRHGQSVANGSGSVSGNNVSNIMVSCVTNSYSVGGQVSGLLGSGLVVSNNGGTNLPVTGATFSYTLASGTKFSFAFVSQPSNPSQTCVFSDPTSATGTVGSSNYIGASVVCTTNSYAVGATVSGLNGGTGLALSLNGGANLPVSANGSFSFPTAVLSGAAYVVAVAAQPTGANQTCDVSGGTGTVQGGPINAVVVCGPISGFAYVANSVATNNSGAGNLSTYAINGTTGALSPLSSVPVSQAGAANVVLTESQLILAAKELGLAAKVGSTSWERLSKLTLPAIAQLNSGEYVVLLRVERDDHIVVGDPRQQRPQRMDRAGFEQLWSGRIVLVKTRLRLDNPNRRFDLFWFAPAVWKYRKTLYEILAASFVIQLFGLATPLFTQVIIDKVLMHKSLSTLHVLAAGMLIMIVFEGILSVLKTNLMTHTSNRIDVALGARLFRHLLHIPLRYFEVRRVGDTVARVRELENIRQFITGSSINVILDLLFTVLFVAVMFLYSGVLTCVMLASLPLFAALSLVVRPMMRSRLEQKFDRGAENQSYLVESVTGIQTVKAMALEPVFYRRWEEQLARYVTASFRASRLSGVGGALGQIIQKLSTLSILWVGAYLVMQGKMTVGQLIAFQMLSARVISPVLRIVQLWQDFQQVGISVDRLGDLINTKAEPALNPSKMSLPAIQGTVRLESVRFRYSIDGPEVLRNLSCEIAPGTTVGVVGRSGSGKSTFTKLLQRLYLPESGRILIDGIDLQQADPMWLRRQIGVVLQENFLFNGTVRENIAIQLPGAPMAQIVEMAKLAGAHDFILELPEAYDTPVGERGTALSGGQRQRIAIARALMANPRILIFDEATSALDYESERIIQDNLGRICKGRTVFIIAHRLSTIRHADTILVLDRGQLVEQGTHNELMSRPGIYHHLFSQQLGGVTHAVA